MRRWAGDRSDELWERHRLRLGDPEVRTFLEKAYQDAMELGIQCLAVFTSGFPHQHNYRRQLLDAFPRVRFAGQLRLEHSPSQRSRVHPRSRARQIVRYGHGLDGTDRLR